MARKASIWALPLVCFLAWLLVGSFVQAQITWRWEKNKKCVEQFRTHTGDDVSTCTPPPSCSGRCYYLLGYKGECSQEMPNNSCQWSVLQVWGAEYQGDCFPQSIGERLVRCRCSDGNPTGNYRMGPTTVCQEYAP